MSKEFFGKMASGENIEIVTLKNDVAELKIMNYAASIVSFKPYGVDIVGGYDTLAKYERDGSNQGAVVGRVANRVENARFTMDGAIYMLPENNNGHCLHSGRGFNRRVWKFEEADDVSVTLSYYSPDGEEGFPSGLMTKIKYTLEGATVILEYEAIPEGKTPIALTNHSYFNLDGFGGKIYEHTATIYADRYTEVNNELIPTGARPYVIGTPFDFTTPHKIGERINENFKGYDHNFVLCPKTSGEFSKKDVPLAATVANGKLTMNVYTDQPGIQFYTANFMKGAPDFRGGVARIPHGAFCLEAQTEPNCINHGEGFYEAGEVYRQITVYEIKKI